MNDNTNYALVHENVNTVNVVNSSFDNLNTIVYKQNSLYIFATNICSIKKHYDELCFIIDNIYYSIIFMFSFMKIIKWHLITNFTELNINLIILFFNTKVHLFIFMIFIIPLIIFMNNIKIYML